MIRLTEKWSLTSRLIFIIAHGLWLTLASTVLAQDNSTKQSKPATLEVNVGVLKFFPPYYLLNENGNPSGFAVDVMNRVAEQSGLSVTYKVKENWAATFKALQRNEIDIIPNLGITENRKKFAVFTTPYETLRISIFTRADTRNVKGIGDFTGRPIGVVDLNAAHKILKSRDNFELRVFHDFSDALFALLSAKIDAIAFPESVAWKLAREIKIDNQIKVVGEPLKEIKRAMAVGKDKAELLVILNRAVDEFITSPEYQKIYVKWFGKPTSFWTVKRVAITMGLAMMALFLFMMWLRYQTNARLLQVLRKSENRFDTSQKCANIGSWELIIETGKLHWSSKVFEMFGYKEGEIEPTYESFLAAIHPEDRQSVVNAVNTSIEENKEYNIEHRVVWSDGTVRWVREIGNVSLDQSEQSPIMLGIARDVTERRHLEEQLRQSQKMDAVGQLTSGIAHDFNNILGIVLGNLELVESNVAKDEETLIFVKAALKGVDRGAEMTRKLLNYSREDVGNEKFVLINEFIKEMETLIVKALTASISTTIHLKENVWPVKINPGDLEDALLNLSLNARDAMPNGGNLVIETSNKVLDEDYVLRNPQAKVGEFVMLSVSDTGLGMTHEVREKALEPFFTTKEKGKGTGLGLNMVYGFVQRSGGHIKIYSEVGEGTTFRIYLPRAYDDGDVEESITSQIDLQHANETVLVVDDEEELVRVAVNHLENLGYKTLHAYDGMQALKVLKENKGIGLLFTDLVLPGGMDGYQLALTSHKEQPALKILLTSGFAKKREELLHYDDRFLESLISNLLNKPYTASELAIAVHKTLDGEG